MNILFVCSSNICRSPYAELYFQKLVDENDVLKNNITFVSSTALFNKMQHIHPKTAKALLDDGVSQNAVDSFKPDFKWCNMKKLKDADVIIGMSKMHKSILPIWYWKKFTTLSEAASGKYIIIPDPWLTKSDEFYRSVMDLIKTFLNVYAEKLTSEFQNKKV